MWNNTKIQIKMKNKIYIDNSIFMELVSEFAAQITEKAFGEETWTEGYKFTDEAQDHFNEKYDEYEEMFNNIANIYSDNKL